MSFLGSVKHAAGVVKNGHAVLLTKKFAPQILLGAGVVGVVTSTVLASKATLNLEAVLDKHRENIDLVNKGAEVHPSTEYSSVHHKRDLTLVHMHTFKELSKLYALPVGLGVISISMIVGAHGIQYKRTGAAVAAYKVVENRFNKYRDAVREEFGMEKDEEFARAYKSEGVVDEEGRETTNITIDGNALNETLYFFEPNNVNWKNSPEYNLSYVMAQQTFANQLLNSRGHVMLNDVLDGLGIDRTPEGAVLGWVLDRAHAEGSKYIDFGIVDCQSPNSRVFGSDRELVECIMLDIKTDGIVWDKI
ncbi:membrane protein [Arthrobacter phage ScienceWizSam]|uniref:Membrane protein n=1 Tax=Arthrobacter phage ScienceWizSam TaxID=2927283 RepID=A0A9E7TDR3_9CAUD|nr:membrane protein [Arthrobacter phage ScienceWizSam]UUG69297.1 membrane protein [Arthrobacter phage ScienceWizSam]